MFGIGNTHIGKIRPINQDFIYVSNDKIGCFDNLYIVADGIGGHNAGEVASQKSIEFFIEAIKSIDCYSKGDILDIMISSLAYANDKILKIAKENKDYENMGTTFLAVTIRENKIYIVHIGDCRLYGVRNSKIARMTTDHTYAMDLFKAGAITKEEAESAKEASVLTRALGTDKSIKADALFCDVFDNDSFIMCSDGLSTMISDEEMKLIALDERLNSNEKVEKLISTANHNGGKDNIAVIIIN